MLPEQGTAANCLDVILAFLLTAASMVYLQALGEGGIDIRGGLKGQLSEGGVGVMHILVQGSPSPPAPPPEGSRGQALQGA